MRGADVVFSAAAGAFFTSSGAAAAVGVWPSFLSFSVVGTKRVKSALRFLICGLASITVVGLLLPAPPTGADEAADADGPADGPPIGGRPPIRIAGGGGGGMPGGRSIRLPAGGMACGILGGGPGGRRLGGGP